MNSTTSYDSQEFTVIKAIDPHLVYRSNSSITSNVDYILSCSHLSYVALVSHSMKAIMHDHTDAQRICPSGNHLFYPGYSSNIIILD